MPQLDSALGLDHDETQAELTTEGLNHAVRKIRQVADCDGMTMTPCCVYNPQFDLFLPNIVDLRFRDEYDAGSSHRR
jgi:hypothetical protein